MKTKEFNAMAFYNPEGLAPAYKHAQAFAGEEGRLATLPDIIEARLSTKPGDFPWESYFTTLSAEYVGLSKAGNPIAIVAHGLGPMASLEGILAAYSHEFKDKSRCKRGGRIPTTKFRELEDGAYGEVSIIDLNATWSRREYAFGNHPITSLEIAEEPLWQARLGSRWQEYAEYHERFAYELQKSGNSHPHSYPCIISMDTASNCSYSCRDYLDQSLGETPDTAIAHLLSTGGLSNWHHDYWRRRYADRESRKSLACDVSCHEWWNGTRLVGIRSGEIATINPGLPNFQQLLKTSQDKLWQQLPIGNKHKKDGFWHLVQIGDQLFTDYQKQGARTDFLEPEYLVTKSEELEGNPRVFKTHIGGHPVFFKYGIEEVRGIAPFGANAYTVGNIQLEPSHGDPTHHVAEINFYRVTVDTNRRLPRMEDIYRDLDLITALVS